MRSEHDSEIANNNGYIDFDETLHEIYLFGDVNETTGAGVFRALRILEKLDSCKKITLFICSSGGSVSETMAIISQLKKCKKPVTIVATGVAYSGALLILASGDPGLRKVEDSCLGMIHGLLRYMSGEHSVIKMKDTMEEATKSMDIIYKHAFVHLNQEQLAKAIELCENGRDNFLTAQEMLDLGLVDEII